MDGVLLTALLFSVTIPLMAFFIDVVKGIEMFDELKVPTVSIIENMVTKFKLHSIYKSGL